MSVAAPAPAGWAALPLCSTEKAQTQEGTAEATLWVPLVRARVGCLRERNTGTLVWGTQNRCFEECLHASPGPRGLRGQVRDALPSTQTSSLHCHPLLQAQVSPGRGADSVLRALRSADRQAPLTCPCPPWRGADRAVAGYFQPLVLTLLRVRTRRDWRVFLTPLGWAGRGNAGQGELRWHQLGKATVGSGLAGDLQGLCQW